MLEDFRNLATAFENEHLLKTDNLFYAKKQAWLASFAENFQSVCYHITELQQKSSFGAISYIDYTMLYTNFINRCYVSEIWIYGEDWFLDNRQLMVCEYDISHMFVHFDELWDKLLQQRKRYVGKVRAMDVKAVMMQALPNFYLHLAHIARLALVGHVEESLLSNIVKNDEFRVMVGEYMADTKTVYRLLKD